MPSAAMSVRRSIIAVISAIALIAGFVIPASADDGVVVSGVVVADDTGQPIADLDISLLRDWGDDWGDVDWTQTNSRGEYSFTLEPGFDYKVQAHQGSSYRGGYLGGTSFAAATTFTTDTVVDGKFPEFRLIPRVLGTLIATVTDDGAPVRDAYVVAYRWVEEQGGYWAWTSGEYSDARGRVSLQVDLGTYTLAAESLGSFLGGATSMPDSPSSSNSVEVTGGGDAAVSFPLAPASVVGVVEDGGFPAGGVNIDAYRWVPDWESWSYYRWAYTDVAGKYRLVLEPGTYTFAYDGQFLGGGADLAIAPTASNSVVVTADAPKTVDFSLPARGLYGTVTEGGDAFGGAVVTAYRWNAEDGEWGWTDSTTADDLGRYRMRLGAGIYTLSFGSEDSGYLSYLGGGASLPGSPDSASSVTLGGEDAQTVDLSMPAPNLKGKVTESGEPVRAWVQAYRWVESDDDGAYWDYDASGSAGPDGTYRMQLKSGTYTFSFDGYFLGGGTGWPGAPSSSNSVEITADATKLNFALPSQSVRGAVTEAGKPLEYAGVTAYRWDQATGQWGTTYYTSADEDGRYRLRLDPGVYALRFAPEDGDHSFYLGGGLSRPMSPTASNSVTIVDGSDKTVDFAVPAPNVTGAVTEAGSSLGTYISAYRWVDGEDGGWDYVSESYSRQDGGYRTWLDPGVYTFQAAGYFLGGGRSMPSAPSASNSVTLAAGVPQVVNLAIPAPNVTGTVTANGSTVMDVEIVAYRWVAEDGGYWEYWTDAYTDDDGKYKLRLDSGTYTFRFDNYYLGGGLSRPTSPTAQNSRVVAEGTPQTVNFALPETFTASGKLTAASGSVEDARVQLYLWDSTLGGWVFAQRETYAAADGTFSLTRVPEGGPYTLRVVKSRFAVGILGGGDAFGAPTAQNSFSVAGANKTGLNVALAPRASTLGKVAGQKLPFCQANELYPNDDDSTGAIDIPFPLRYFGNTYTQLYVNNNGNVTFDGPLSQYTPDSLDGAQSKPIIAPFFADVDTRDTAESDIVTYGASPDGTQFCVNWVDVAPYGGSNDAKLNSFQLLLTKKEGATGRSAGDFDVTFNYDQIQWDRGSASGQTAAAAGYASGSGEDGTFFQLPGSLTRGAFLDGGSHALVGGRQNSSQVGRYEYQIRNDGRVSTLGNLTGKVLLPGGGPAANVYVEVVSGSRAYYTRTNASGTYSVSGIAAGPYTVRAWPESDDLIQAGASATVVVGETVNVPDIRLGAPAPMPPSVGLTSPSFGTATPNQVPTVYYQDPLTLSYDGAAGGTASYKVVGLDGTVIREGVLVEQSPGKYRGTIPPLYPATGNATVQITFTPASGTAQQIAFNIYIDPSGVVLDKWGFPVAGATATLLRSEDPDEEPFVAVPNGSDIMSPRNRKNPDTTDEHGLFGWDVTAAWYKVRVAKSGYTTFESGAMEVPPERLDLVFTLAGGSAPSLTSLVGGTPTVGAELTAHKPDGLSDDFEAAGYRWFRDGSRIDGADAKTYAVVAADAGKKVHAEVTVKRRSVAVDPLHPTENIVEFAEVVAPSAAVKVAKLRPTLVLVGTAGAAGEATLSATLALPGTAVNETAATLKILDDGKELSQTIAVKNGNGLVTLTGLTPGKHTFTVGFAGDAAHDAVVSGAAAVTVAAPPVVTPGKAKPTLTLAGAPGKAGEAKLTATLTVPGKAAKGTTATLKILDGKTVLKQTVAIKDGKGSVTLKGLKPGKHSFTVSYAGDANMEAATSKAAAVTVAKHVPTVALKAKAGKKKGTATLDVTLKLPGTAAKSTKATLKIYDGKKLLKQTVKIKNGKGKVTLSKLAAGRHPFTVVYTGDSTYSKATSKVASVGKDKPKLTVKAKAGKKGKATLTVTLKLPGTAAKSTKATLKVYDGKKLLKQKISVKKGKGTVSLSKLKKGTHTFKVTYAGNSSYEAKSVTAKATIK